jgi:hypothetical protein
MSLLAYAPQTSLELTFPQGEIYGFFHLAFMGEWRNVFDCMVADLESSGLLNATRTIFLGTSGQPAKFKLPRKFVWAVQNPLLSDGENKTTKFIFSIREQLKGSKVWYIHTKGVSRNNRESDSWREYMMYFNVRKWNSCIRALQNHDICGVSWDYIHRNGHELDFIEGMWWDVLGRFSGNFWWANGSYIAKIKSPFPDFNPYFDGTVESNRHLSEFFLGRNQPKACDLAADTEVKKYRGRLYSVYVDPIWYTNNYDNLQNKMLL